MSGVTGWRDQRNPSWSGRIIRTLNISARARLTGHSSLTDLTSPFRTCPGPKMLSPILYPASSRTRERRPWPMHTLRRSGGRVALLGRRAKGGGGGSAS